MRNSLFLTFAVVVVFAGGFFYNLAQAVCPIPLHYRVGELDARFNLSLDEAKVALAEATEVWEEATGQNLFTYDDEANFAVNFIFDERQQLVNEEEDFTEKLADAENRNEVLTLTYDTLVNQYENIKTTYEREVSSFEQRLSEYNATVQKYNTEGGAPPDVFDELEAERDALDRKRGELNGLSNRLNQLVTQINDLGDRGNDLIADYNEDVGEFNERFGESREFTQGDYRGDHINIYTYKDEWELKTVLVHEFGHALSLGHVENDSSVMYYLIGDQPIELELSTEDLAEFNRICGDMNLWDKIVYRLNLSQK